VAPAMTRCVQAASAAACTSIAGLLQVGGATCSIHVCASNAESVFSLCGDNNFLVSTSRNLLPRQLAIGKAERGA